MELKKRPRPTRAVEEEEIIQANCKMKKGL
jgi:hypothetical protein